MSVVVAADISGFAGLESQLVQRMVQNLHPRVKSYLLFVMLRITDFCLPAMLDSGSSLPFLRRDVFDNIKRLGRPYTVGTPEERCLMANGESCVVSEVVVLGIKVHSISWKFKFLVLGDCPIPCILGVDLFTFAKVRIDFFRPSV
jgi:hypothetical protein